MTRSTIITIASVAIALLITLVLLVMYFSTSNTEIRLRNQANAVQLDNQNEFDNMWKTIAQVVQVTQAERESVERIIIGYADARSGDSGTGSFINAVREALPTIDSRTFTNLQNTIVASRDRFAGRQRMLIDIKREHDNILQTFPGSLFVGGRPELKITIITSSRTQNTFQSGLDDNIDLGIGNVPPTVE
jgi:hypothetical protein